VLLLDDDAEVEPDFFTQIAAYRAAADDPDHLIVTGVEIRDGFVIEPHEQSFLGFQNIPYEPGDTVQTIVMNATVFPAALFERVRFDERLAYGYDEVDVATRAVASGYRIEICTDACVRHRLSPIHRDANYQHIDAARLYVTTRRYASTQGSPLKGVVYFVLASAHIVVASARRDGGRGVLRGIRSVRRGAERLLAARRRQELV
jgi:GT2 family glycosyltransferase